MKTELILAFDASVVNALYPVGITPYDPTHTRQLDEAVIIQPRYVAEVSSTTRHPIPYIVLYDESVNQVLLYRRGAKVGESRLSGNASVGFGGHVDIDSDVLTHPTRGSKFSALDAIYYTVDKELNEELGVDLYDEETSLVGVLRDDSNSVGLVHLGFVMIKYVDKEKIVRTNEDELEMVGWTELNNIDVENAELNLENWSKMVITHLQMNGV